MSFIDRLQSLIDKSNLTHKDIEKKTGIKNISHYKSGRVKPSFDAIVALSDFFEVSTDWLLKGVGFGSDSVINGRIPLFYNISAGIENLNNDLPDSFIELPSGISADFACRLVGDNMSWIGIYDGDTVFLQRVAIAQNGQVIAVHKLNADDSLRLGFYCKKNGQAYLCSANPDYADILLTPHHRIDGVLVALLRKRLPSSADYESFLCRKDKFDDTWFEITTLAISNGIPARFVRQFIELQIGMAQNRLELHVNKEL